MSITLFLFVFLSIISPTQLWMKGSIILQSVIIFKVPNQMTHFCWHDILSGSNPSSVVINPPISNSSFFGSVTVSDNRLTTEVALNSTLVGQAQGVYAATGQGEVSVLMVMNFVFKTGKYNGSTISILGRNAILTKVREMPVIGGSGLFRFARGYVEARTMWLDQKSGDATVEYSCYVLHY